MLAVLGASGEAARDVEGAYASVSLLALDKDRIACTRLAAAVLCLTERQQYESCISRRRALSYLGGRLAAKLAALRMASHLAPAGGALALPAPSDMRVDVLTSGQRVIDLCAPIGRVNVSISHCPTRAVAVAMCGVSSLGVDVENSDSSVRSTTAYFHAGELRQRAPASARARWTMKEALTKLLGASPKRYLLTVAHGAPVAVIPQRLDDTPVLAMGPSGSVAYLAPSLGGAAG